MIQGTLCGVEVGCEYRRPYDHARPDCWQEPHKGVVLPLDDVRAWRNTLAFPELTFPDGPPQDKVTAHVQRCLGEGLLNESVPVLYVSSIDGEEFMQWDRITALKPYAEELEAWRAAREEKRKSYN
jgi:hypothetical protein